MVQKGLNASAESIDSGQPALTAQADLNLYFLPVFFLSKASFRLDSTAAVA